MNPDKNSDIRKVTTSLEDAIEQLRTVCPHGHKEFVPLLVEAAKLHSDKNHDYAKGGNALGNFERASKILELYPNLKLSNPVVVLLVYMIKQFDAVLWHLNTGNDVKVEGPISRLFDMFVYSGIAICALKDKQKEIDASW